MTDSNPFHTDADHTGQPDSNQTGYQPNYQQPGYPQPDWSQQPQPGTNGYAGGPTNPPTGPQYPSNPFMAAPAPQYDSPTPTDMPLDQPWYGCPPIEAVKRYFTKYATFSGRASRSEFWWVALFTTVVGIVLFMLTEASSAFGFLQFVWTVGTIVPSLAIGVRRLHDANHSGGWIAIPYALMIIGVVAAVASVMIGVLQVVGSLPYGYYDMDLEDMYYLSQFSQGRTALGNALAGMGTAVLLSLLAALAGFIVLVVLMALPSKHEGARFDRVATPMVQGYGMPAPMPGMPGAAGQPYQAGAPVNYSNYSAAPAAQPQPYQTPTAGQQPLNAYGEPATPMPQYGTPVTPVVPVTPTATDTPSTDIPTAPATSAAPHHTGLGRFERH